MHLTISEVKYCPVGEATFVYDANGNQLQKLTAPNSNRMPVSIEQIPLDLQHAVVAIEDERFYEHNGIDIKGILRAGVRGILNGGNFTEGASTITQQLLKITFLQAGQMNLLYSVLNVNFRNSTLLSN